MYQQFSNNRIQDYSKSLCCQPGYYSDELHYREVYLTQRDPAHRIVSMCYEAFPKKSRVSIPVIPDGCVDVVLAFGNDFCQGISVCGTISTLYAMDFQESDYIFGMRFLPGKFPPELMGDISSFMDEQHDLALHVREWKFIDAMRQSANFYERVALAREYLSEFARSDEYKEMLVQHTVDMICNSGGNVGIERISQELVYSSRYVERVFKEYTGFSPKKMCRLVRAHKALLMLLCSKEFSKTMISLECGYADLSHMNRELKSVLGVTPKMVGREDLYLGSMKTSQTVYNF